MQRDTNAAGKLGERAKRRAYNKPARGQLKRLQPWPRTCTFDWSNDQSGSFTILLLLCYYAIMLLCHYAIMPLYHVYGNCKWA